MRKSIYIAFAATALLAACTQPQRYSWEKDLQHRIELDFCKTQAEVKEYIQKYIPDVTDAQIEEWTASGELESMVIDGQLRYFENAAANLFRINAKCKAIKAEAQGTIVTEQCIRPANRVHNLYLEADTMTVEYTLTVDADAVPAGETIRCWLPFPLLGDAELLESNREAQPSQDSGIPQHSQGSRHCTMYMEAQAVAGEPTVFYEKFRFVGKGIEPGFSPESLQPLSEEERAYYTGEQAPHIVFNERMRELSDSLCANCTSLEEKRAAIFNWIGENIPWASAREYSTIPNIPEYVLDVRHGDCGQQTLLFMTLARIQGIPCRWQSGFSMKPGSEGLHDWSEIWVEGRGWQPMDMSRRIYEGIDSYRMIVNSGWGDALSPAKKYPRSETCDFQRGEVEWRGGNLYFDQWHKNMKVSHSTIKE